MEDSDLALHGQIQVEVADGGQEQRARRPTEGEPPQLDPDLSPPVVAARGRLESRVRGGVPRLLLSFVVDVDGVAPESELGRRRRRVEAAVVTPARRSDWGRARRTCEERRRSCGGAGRGGRWEREAWSFVWVRAWWS